MADQVVVLEHLLHRVGQGDGDGQGEPLGHRHHQNRDPDDEEGEEGGGVLAAPGPPDDGKLLDAELEHEDDDAEDSCRHAHLADAQGQDGELALEDATPFLLVPLLRLLLLSLFLLQSLVGLLVVVLPSDAVPAPQEGVGAGGMGVVSSVMLLLHFVLPHPQKQQC